MKTYIFHANPGHGWCAVKRNELARLGILNQISSCSYQRGGTVYLEEDKDYRVFVVAKEAAGEEYTYRESFQENTPILGYDHFSC